MIAIIQKFQNELTLFILALLVLGAGVSYNTEEDHTFDKSTREIDAMMQDALKHPSTNNLEDAQQELFYTYYPWAERQTSENKDTFIAYLEACNQVIIQKSNGEKPDTTEMIRLRNKLL